MSIGQATTSSTSIRQAGTSTVHILDSLVLYFRLDTLSRIPSRMICWSCVFCQNLGSSRVDRYVSSVIVIGSTITILRSFGAEGKRA